MAFILRNLQPLGATARGNGSTPADLEANVASKWGYTHPTDTVTEIEASGYFNQARDILNKFDVIETQDSAGDAKIVFVSAAPKSPLVDTPVTVFAADIDAA